jgi:hypothetical protein
MTEALGNMILEGFKMIHKANVAHKDFFDRSKLPDFGWGNVYCVDGLCSLSSHPHTRISFLLGQEMRTAIS